MSDFDKEKEREKLREKFEQEEDRRETTQQMSELLLKGATMLNVHCQECASPIFRYDGDEFCPTCQRPVEEIATAGPGDLTGPANVPDSPETNAAEGAPPQPAETAQPDAGDVEPAGETPVPNGAEPPESTQPSPPEPTPAVSDPSVDIADDDAVGALTDAIARLSARAAAADDPRQAQELLAAAKEAAETVSELRGAGHSGS